MTRTVEFEFEPFDTVFIARRTEVAQMLDVYGWAMWATQGAARLSEVLNHSPEAVAEVTRLERLAKAEVDQGLPLLHNAALVLMWGALETSIRDFLVRWLLRYPSCLQLPPVAQLRVRVGEYEALSSSDRMRFLIGLLERDLGSSLKPGVGRFTSLLKVFDLTPIVDDACRSNLFVMAAVRNVIAHQAGIADDRFVELCPAFGASVGQPVRIQRAQLIEFINAAGMFGAAIVEAARRSAKKLQPLQ